MSRIDLSQLLREWPYEPGKINVRKVRGEDGREKLQMRIDMGVLQFELSGRPDGQQPDGFETLLTMHRARLEDRVRRTGTSNGFALSPDECAALREEAVQLHHRYVALFALRDFHAVIRDAEMSLAIFDLCRDFGASREDSTVLEQFRAQVITMRTRAEAELALASQRPKDALAAIDRGLHQLRRVFDEAGASSRFDEANEVQLLRGMRDVLVPKLPASQKAELQERLRAALDAENYELAAILRDELRMM